MKLQVPDSKSFMPLHIQQIGDNEISMTHFYEQQGELYHDPDMQLQINRENKTVEALTFQQDGLPFPFQEVYPNYPAKDVFRPKLKTQLNSFLRQWLTNIQDQGYEPVQITYSNGQNKNLITDQESAPEAITDEIAGPIKPAEKPVMEQIKEQEQVLYGHMQRLVPLLLVSESQTVDLKTNYDEGPQNYLTVKQSNNADYELQLDFLHGCTVPDDFYCNIALDHENQSAQIVHRNKNPNPCIYLEDLEMVNRTCADFKAAEIQDLSSEDFALLKELSPEVISGEAESVNFIGPDNVIMTIKQAGENLFAIEYGSDQGDFIFIDETFTIALDPESQTAEPLKYIASDIQNMNLAVDILELRGGAAYIQLLSDRLNQRLTQAENEYIKTVGLETLDQFNSNKLFRLIPQMLAGESDRMVFANHGSGHFYEFERQPGNEIHLSLYANEDAPKQTLSILEADNDALLHLPLDKSMFARGPDNIDFELAKTLQKIDSDYTLVQGYGPEPGPDNGPKM